MAWRSFFQPVKVPLLLNWATGTHWLFIWSEKVVLRTCVVGSAVRTLGSLSSWPWSTGPQAVMFLAAVLPGRGAGAGGLPAGLAAVCAHRAEPASTIPARSIMDGRSDLRDIVLLLPSKRQRRPSSAGAAVGIDDRPHVLAVQGRGDALGVQGR